MYVFLHKGSFVWGFYILFFFFLTLVRIEVAGLEINNVNVTKR
jgi:hypothetical protein